MSFSGPSNGPTETEIKLPVPDVDAMHQELAAAGFRIKTPRTFESNLVYDTPQGTLRGEGKVLRVREYGPDCVLTFKSAGQAGRHKVREELETKVQSAPALQQIFERLGYHISFRYEKFRTEYTDAEGAAVVDETPIGNFLELEGDGEWIDRVAARLGFSETDYITKSYGRLYAEYCDAQKTAFTHMIFSDTPYGTSTKKP